VPCDSDEEVYLLEYGEGTVGEDMAGDNMDGDEEVEGIGGRELVDKDIGAAQILDTVGVEDNMTGQKEEAFGWEWCALEAPRFAQGNLHTGLDKAQGEGWQQLVALLDTVAEQVESQQLELLCVMGQELLVG